MTNYSKPIIFCDWYGVLSESHIFEGTQVDIKSSIEEIIFEDSKKLLKQGCLEFNGIQFCNQIAQKLGLNSDQIEEYYKNGWNNVTWNQELLIYLQNFRTDYFLVLISDNFEEFNITVAPRLRDFFDEIHCSFQLGYLKSDPNNPFYKNTAKRLNSDIREAILIDDTKQNREIFATFGKATFESIQELRNQSQS